MMLSNIKLPDVTQGEMSTQQKLNTIYEWMLQLDKQLRYVLQNLDEENLGVELSQTVADVKKGLEDLDKTVKDEELEVVTKKIGEELDRKVEDTYVDPDTGEEIHLWSQIIQTAKEITSKVSYGEYNTYVQQTAQKIESKANATKTDPTTGEVVDLWTQVTQTAKEITSKADAARKDPTTGQTVNLWTQVTQTAEEIKSKADATRKDPATGQTVTLWTQVTQNAEEIKSKAAATRKDPSTGQNVDLWTQVTQNAEDITTKANATRKDPTTGQTVTLWTQVTQNADAIKTKANATKKDPSTGQNVDLWSQVTQSADNITAIVTGQTAVGKVHTSSVDIDPDGISVNSTGDITIAAGGTFKVDSGNFALDGQGNLSASGAQINGTLLNNGYPVLTPQDIYIGTAEPKNKRLGMIWIKPGEDETPSVSQTTHSWTYTQGSRAGLKSNPIHASLTGTAVPAVTGGTVTYTYQFSIPVYLGGKCNGDTVTISVGGMSFSGQVYGSQYDHRTVEITATGTQWIANAGSIAFTLTASSNNVLCNKSDSGYQITMISRSSKA